MITPSAESPRCECPICGPHQTSITAAVRFLDAQLHAATGRPCSYPPTELDALEVVDIGMRKYVERFAHHHPHFEPSVLVVAMIYVGRLQSGAEQEPRGVTGSPLQLTWYNVHRMLAASFLLAYKMLLDYNQVKSNKHMAKVAGISLVEMNRIERYALAVLQHRLVVGLDEFEREEARIGGGVSGRAN